MQNIYLIISSVLIFFSFIVYEWSIINGGTKPHRTTRLVLLIITSLGAISLFAAHDKVAVWLIGISAVHQLIVFLLSLKFGIGGWSRIDLFCLFIALIGIITWQITDNPALGLYAAVAADFTGMIPTLIKTYHLPDTEYLPVYILDILATIFTLLAIQNWQVQGFLYPLYLFIISLIMFLLIIRPTLNKRLFSIKDNYKFTK